MTPSLHPQLLAAFLDGKSCATIAGTFNLTIEDVLSWFESDLTQSTLRRLESLQLQQARIVSFSVLPAATGSLSRTSTTASDPILQTRAASNLVRLGLRFSGAPSLREVPSAREIGRESSAQQPTEDREARSSRDAHATSNPHPSREARPTDTSSLRQPAAECRSPAASPPTSVPYAASVRSVPSASSTTNPPTDLICESLRAEFAALRTASANALKSPSRIAASKSRQANHRTESAPRPNPACEHQTQPSDPIAPLLSRRASRISSLRSYAGAIASRDAFSALDRAPPRNSHSPPPTNSAA